MIKNVNQISEQSFLLDFGNKITKEINLDVINVFHYIFDHIHKNNFLHFKNCVPSYNKLLVQFDPSKKNKKQIVSFINSINTEKLNIKNNNEEIEIPICYDEEYALDIKDVSKKTNLEVNKIIETHLSTNFFIYMIGFMPGLPFMGDLDESLNIPRLNTPRIQVPALSVGIVEKFCVIYPNESPGGWNIIGRTPIKLFFKDKQDPTLLQPGANVKFKAISKNEFNELKE